MFQCFRGGEPTPPGYSPALRSPPLPPLPLHQGSALHCMATTTKTDTMPQETGALSWSGYSRSLAHWAWKKKRPIQRKAELPCCWINTKQHHLCCNLHHCNGYILCKGEKTAWFYLHILFKKKWKKQLNQLFIHSNKNNPKEKFI